jgi:hypothetical protein
MISCAPIQLSSPAQPKSSASTPAVQFNSLWRLLKDKHVRLGKFDRLIHQRQH